MKLYFLSHFSLKRRHYKIHCRFLNGQPLSFGSRRTARHDFGLATLDIAYCLPDDVGKYTCRARNRVGQVECSAHLACKG